MTREERNKYHREWYAKNKEKYREYAREYYRKNYSKKVILPIHSKKVIQVDYYTGEQIDTYNSIKEAAEDNYISVASISKTLNQSDGKLNGLKLAFKFVTE